MNLMIDDKFSRMPWDEIDAVVFDVGRVLLSFEPEDILRRYVPDAQAHYDELMVRVFKSPYWTMRDHGTMTNEEAIEAMTAGNETLAPWIRRIMESWVEMKDVIQEGVEALRRCREMGKKIYILSNYADEAFAHVDGKYDFFGLCERKFVSSRLGMMKPDPRIYAHVVNETGHAPERMLFIDDSPANIEAALDAGWQGLCYNKAGKLEKFFAI